MSNEKVNWFGVGGLFLFFLYFTVVFLLHTGKSEIVNTIAEDAMFGGPETLLGAFASGVLLFFVGLLISMIICLIVGGFVYCGKETYKACCYGVSKTKEKLKNVKKTKKETKIDSNKGMGQAERNI